MHPRTLVTLASLIIVFACATSQNSRYVEGNWNVPIEGVSWAVTRNAQHCKDRVSAAMEVYMNAPLYRPERGISARKFLVNDQSKDCWVELWVPSVSGPTFIYRVTIANEVIDKRMFTDWLPHVRPYPDQYLDVE